MPIQASRIDDDDDAPVKKAYYVRKMVWILLATLIGSGLVVDIVFGVRKREDSSTLTSSPTLLTKKWVKAGEISVSNGASLSMSPSGNRVAVMNSFTELGDGLVETELVTVLVYQQDDDNGSWSLLGDTISGTLVSSLSLLGTRLAIASLDPDIGVTVYQLQDDNTWKRLGNEIEIAEADSVLLAQDGNLLARARYEVSLYSFTNEHGWSLISTIPTRTVQNEKAISSDGTTNSHISTGPLLPSPHVRRWQSNCHWRTAIHEWKSEYLSKRCTHMETRGTTQWYRFTRKV